MNEAARKNAALNINTPSRQLYCPRREEIIRRAGRPTSSANDKMNPLVVQTRGSAILIEGDLTASNADEFAGCLLALNLDERGEITLDLCGLDIDDGAAIAVAVNAIRQLCARASKLILIAAPQMLCHNLYRIGLLGGHHIELINMREDEPAGF
jgi:anti-anti-sigma regulatory factor